MGDHLHPAVRDVAATGAIGVAAGAAVMGVGAVVDSTGAVLLVAAAALGVAALITRLRMPRAVREVLEELRPAPDAPVDEGVGRAVWWTPPVIAAGLGLAALLSLPVVACGGVLLGIGVSELGEAHWLRRWERLNDMRLLYRADYRWLGTNGRVIGRGWFDPANFVAAD